MQHILCLARTLSSVFSVNVTVHVCDPHSKQYIVVSGLFGASKETLKTLRVHIHKYLKVCTFSFIFFCYFSGWAFDDRQPCWFQQQTRMGKQALVQLHNKSSRKTGGMPMAALRDQLDMSSLLFLMCSGYKAMCYHTSPASLHTPSSVFWPLDLVFISCSI